MESGSGTVMSAFVQDAVSEHGISLINNELLTLAPDASTAPRKR